MLLGQKIKELRMENGVLQRQLASLLEIDTPMFSKIERGDRRAKRTQVVQMANYFNVDEKGLLTLWVADKVLDAVEDEEELKLEGWVELVAGSTDAAQEKHVPVVTKKCKTVKVDVGSVAHPMTEEHLIEWIALETEPIRKVITRIRQTQTMMGGR